MILNSMLFFKVFPQVMFHVIIQFIKIIVFILKTTENLLPIYIKYWKFFVSSIDIAYIYNIKHL